MEAVHRQQHAAGVAQRSNWNGIDLNGDGVVESDEYDRAVREAYLEVCPHQRIPDSGRSAAGLSATGLTGMDRQSQALQQKLAVADSHIQFLKKQLSEANRVISRDPRAHYMRDEEQEIQFRAQLRERLQTEERQRRQLEQTEQDLQQRTKELQVLREQMQLTLNGEQKEVVSENDKLRAEVERFKASADEKETELQESNRQLEAAQTEVAGLQQQLAASEGKVQQAVAWKATLLNY